MELQTVILSRIFQRPPLGLQALKREAPTSDRGQLSASNTRRRISLFLHSVLPRDLELYFGDIAGRIRNVAVHLQHGQA